MPSELKREPQLLTKEEFLRADELRGRVEFVRGVVGPCSDSGKLTLLANWGADEIIRLTGAEVWRDALRAMDKGD